MNNRFTLSYCITLLHYCITGTFFYTTALPVPFYTTAPPFYTSAPPFLHFCAPLFFVYLDALARINPERRFARIHARLLAGVLRHLRLMGRQGERQADQSAADATAPGQRPNHLHAVPIGLRPVKIERQW